MRNKITVCIVSIFFVLLFTNVSATPVSATPIVIDTVGGIDAILVIDTSGSMNSTDPERIALEAATLFMGMMETNSSRIAIVPFSGDVHSVVPLTPINDPNLRNRIRSSVSGLAYQGSTDIGLGLRTAAEMLLNDPSETNSPIILLFTDGHIDLPAWFNRTNEDSYMDTWWAVDNVGEFTPIHTIGLNFDGTINIDFLESISNRTFASSNIITDAALLPSIFNEIFADHMRTSIDTIYEFVSDGGYTYVPINIDSHFVAEANIIMLSSRPIQSITLQDPTGREVAFDDNTYTIATANRYSIIKIMNPQAGEWTLRVQGIPDDHITVNLIYNYTIDIAFSVSQPDMASPFFDPTAPLTVHAALITQLPMAQTQALMNETVVLLYAFDLNDNIVSTVEMEFIGTSFTSAFTPHPPQDVRIHIHAHHPAFELTSPTVTIVYDPALLETMEDIPYVYDPELPDPILEEPAQVVDPQPAPDSIPGTVSEPTESTNLTPFILIAIAIICIIVAILLLRLQKEKAAMFIGHLELRTLRDDKYTSLETPDLTTFAGRISLEEFIQVSLGARAGKILVQEIPLNRIYIQPATLNNRPRLQLASDNSCYITDGDGNPISQKKFLWEKDTQLIFSIDDTHTQIEITYRINED